MKLYSWGAAPNPRRVLIYLAEKGIELEVVEAGEGAHLTDDYLARYDGRIVPMLELDDGTQIGEAMAICRYLEDGYPAPPLFGVNRRDRALVDMWERRAELEAFAGLAEVFRNSTPAFAGRGLPGFEEPIEQIPALIERGRSASPASMGASSANSRTTASSRAHASASPTSPRSAPLSSRPRRPRPGCLRITPTPGAGTPRSPPARASPARRLDAPLPVASLACRASGHILDSFHGTGR